MGIDGPTQTSRTRPPKALTFNDTKALAGTMERSGVPRLCRRRLPGPPLAPLAGVSPLGGGRLLAGVPRRSALPLSRLPLVKWTLLLSGISSRRTLLPLCMLPLCALPLSGVTPRRGALPFSGVSFRGYALLFSGVSFWGCALPLSGVSPQRFGGLPQPLLLRGGSLSSPCVMPLLPLVWVPPPPLSLVWAAPPLSMLRLMLPVPLPLMVAMYGSLPTLASPAGPRR